MKINKSKQFSGEIESPRKSSRLQLDLEVQDL